MKRKGDHRPGKNSLNKVTVTVFLPWARGDPRGRKKGYADNSLNLVAVPEVNNALIPIRLLIAGRLKVKAKAKMLTREETELGPHPVTDADVQLHLRTPERVIVPST